MFHSVGNEKSSWDQHWLSVSLEHFENFCRYLNKRKYISLFLDDWYDSILVKKKNDRRSIVLTFDDGYLDNWVYVYPLLKKYGLKGTIFVNPEFVENNTNIRPNLENILKKQIHEKDLQTLGYLNWGEIIKMQESGIVDIQSHSMSHNFYFKSNSLIDIYEGQPKYSFLNWFINPENKPYSLRNEQSDNIPLGYPIFESGRALALRRYFPDQEIINESIKQYPGSNTNKKEILEHLNTLIKHYPGRFESDEEMETRYRYELIHSKEILEQKLNKKIDFLCWPGGGYNDISLSISIEAGYKASTISSKDKLSKKDLKSSNKRFSRIGMGSHIFTRKGLYYVRNKNHLTRIFKGRNGNLALRFFLKIKKELIKVTY